MCEASGGQLSVRTTNPSSRQSSARVRGGRSIDDPARAGRSDGAFGIVTPASRAACIRRSSQWANIVHTDVIAAAEKSLGYRFRDPHLLMVALTHASSSDTRIESNERLEFLGDSVLGLIVCEALYRRFPGLLEGDLTKIKSTVVSRKTCEKLIREMGIENQLILGKGMLNHERLPGSVAAALLESIVGAIYLDAGDSDTGLRAAKEFLMPWIGPVIERAAASGHQQNFKSVLQQYAQDQLQQTPMYLLLDEQGPDHAKCFEVCVQLDAQRFDSCWGQSKKEAEQKAALQALSALGVIEFDSSGQARICVVDEQAGDEEL